jgi:hypothetical protein
MQCTREFGRRRSLFTPSHRKSNLHKLSLPTKNGIPPLPPENKPDNLTLSRAAAHLTISDSDTFVPEFGINIPPTLGLQFQALINDPAPHQEERELTLGPNLSSPLRTPAHHDFSLQGYEIGGGLSSAGDFGDDGGFEFTGGLYGEEDDALRNANDAGTLDFNIDIPGLSSERKRVMTETPGSLLKRARVLHSLDSEDMRRIAREDHDVGGGQQFDFTLYGGGGDFDEAQFDVYRTPPPPQIEADLTGEAEPSAVPVAKRRRRALIVQDSVTLYADSTRAWQERYKEAMRSAKARQEKIEMGRVASVRAAEALWGKGKLHPLLARVFSREALLHRWDRDNKSGSGVSGKRKLDAISGGRGGGDIEIGMGGGFGDGGFRDMRGTPDPLDLTVFPPTTHTHTRTHKPRFLRVSDEIWVGNGNWSSRPHRNRTRTHINPIPPNALDKHFIPSNIPSTLTGPPSPPKLV